MTQFLICHLQFTAFYRLNQEVVSSETISPMVAGSSAGIKEINNFVEEYKKHLEAILKIENQLKGLEGAFFDEARKNFSSLQVEDSGSSLKTEDKDKNTPNLLDSYQFFQQNTSQAIGEYSADNNALKEVESVLKVYEDRIKPPKKTGLASLLGIFLLPVLTNALGSFDKLKLETYPQVKKHLDSLKVRFKQLVGVYLTEIGKDGANVLAINEKYKSNFQELKTELTTKVKSRNNRDNREINSIIFVIFRRRLQ